MAVYLYFHGKWRWLQQSSVICHRQQIMTFFSFFLFFLFLGEDAAPHLNPHLSAAEVSVPGTNTDNEPQSLSSACGDLDSSGTDTF